MCFYQIIGDQGLKTCFYYHGCTIPCNLRCSNKSKSTRIADKTQLSSQRKQKKQKSTPKKEVKHIPIDLFFVKSNQNL